MVAPAGFEPTTSPLGGVRAIQLCHGAIEPRSITDRETFRRNIVLDVNCKALDAINSPSSELADVFHERVFKRCLVSLYTIASRPAKSPLLIGLSTGATLHDPPVKRCRGRLKMDEKVH